MLAVLSRLKPMSAVLKRLRGESAPNPSGKAILVGPLALCGYEDDDHDSQEGDYYDVTYGGDDA